MSSTHHNGASVSVVRNDGKAVYMIGGDIGSRFEYVDIEKRVFLTQLFKVPITTMIFTKM